MAKRGILEHEKTFRLADFLRIYEYYAVGMEECLFQWAAKYKPTGDLTGVNPTLFARAIRYPGNGPKLFKAFIHAGLIDQLSDGRLLIHDWSEHAESSVHQYLKKRGECFADGSAPFNRSRNSQTDDNSSQTVHEPVVNGSRLPLPLPLPLASALPLPEEREPLPSDESSGAKPASTSSAAARRSAGASLSSLSTAEEANGKIIAAAEGQPSLDAFFEHYDNHRGGMRPCHSRTKKRKEQLRSRIRNGLTLTRWSFGVAEGANTLFCCGKNTRKQAWTIDNLLDEDNFAKLMEGKYRDAKPPMRITPSVGGYKELARNRDLDVDLSGRKPQ
jgi:hypothetical protein